MKLDSFKSCTGILPDTLDSLQKVAEIYSDYGNIDITAKHDEWIEVCEACARYGESARECFHQFSSHYPNYDRGQCEYHFSNCLQSTRGDVSIGTVIWMMQQAGIDVLKELRDRNYLSTPRIGRPRKVKDGDKEEVKEAVTQQWLNFLHELGQFRFNVVLGKTEVLLKGEQLAYADRNRVKTVYFFLSSDRVLVSDRLKKAEKEVNYADIKEEDF